MRGLWDKTVFAVGDVDYSWRDIALLGVLHGDWREVFDRARVGRDLVRAAGEAEVPPVSDEDIESAANDFRYARDLVTADEMSAWLERWGLDADEWMNWVTADVLRARAEPEEAPGEARTDPDDLEGAIHAEAVCSSALPRMAYRLAERISISRKVAEDGAETPAEGDSEPLPDEPRLLDEVERLHLGLAPAEARRQLARLAALDRVFLAFRESAISPGDVEARARARQADWMRVRCRILQLTGEDVAREALFSIQEDGAEMDEVAADAGGEITEGTFFMEELEPALRDHLLAAQKDEVVGPLRNGDGFALVLVQEKRLAAPDDEDIRRKAFQSLLESTVGREVENRVSWRWGK